VRSFEPPIGAQGLAPHAHRLELVTSTRGLVFPQLCPACGGPAVDWLAVPKVFMRHHSDSPWTYVLAKVEVPFCAPCIERHRGEAERQTLGQQLRRALFSEGAIPMYCAGITGLFFLKESVLKLGRGYPSGALVTGGMATFCLLIASWSAHDAWGRTARDRVPPQTSVTRAFDYSDDTSDLFDQPRYVYAMQDGAFADAFRRLNEDAVWDPAAPRALEAQRKRWVAYVAFGAVALALVLWDWLAG